MLLPGPLASASLTLPSRPRGRPAADCALVERATTAAAARRRDRPAAAIGTAPAAEVTPAARPLPPYLGPAGQSGARRRAAQVAMVAVAHGLAMWGALQIDVVRRAVADVAPQRVQVVVLPSTRPAAPNPEVPLPAARPTPMPHSPPPMLPPAVTLIEPPLPTTLPASVAPPRAPAVTAPPAISAVAAAPAPAPPPPSPRVLPSSAVAYLVRPPIEVPLASRRLRESGTVLLRVWVGIDGVPRQVTVQRSSGFTRLDEQAVWAMKQARFTPQVEEGTAVEWIVVQAVQYEVD